MAKKKTAKTDAATWCVWIGPGIRGVIQYGQVFPVPREDAKGVLPEKIAALWDEGANALLEGPDELPAARIAAKTEGSALWKLARKLAEKAARK